MIVFMDLVNAYKEKPWEQKATQIVTEYVKVGSPKEFNIENDFRVEVLQSYVKARSEESFPPNLFDPLVEVVSNDMQVRICIYTLIFTHIFFVFYNLKNFEHSSTNKKFQSY